jgi:hypothetical protein
MRTPQIIAATAITLLAVAGCATRTEDKPAPAAAQTCPRANERFCAAGVGDLLAAVAFGEHDHGCAEGLEEIDVSVHAASGGGTEGTGGETGRSFGGAGVVDGVILDILR